MDTGQFIKMLQISYLVAQCPECNKKFKMSESLLFDGRGEYPQDAESRMQELLQALKDRQQHLDKQKEKDKLKSSVGATSVGIGNVLEKILPATKNFELVPSDCRFLAEPIDMVEFRGLTEDTLKRISFMDVKTGQARLNDHQKQVRDAISEHRVMWRQY